MEKQMKKSFDAYFTSRNLPSEEAKKRMLDYKEKSRIKRSKRYWIPATIGIILVGCLILLIYIRPQTDEQITASAAEVEQRLQLYMTEEEIAQYTIIFESERPIEVRLLPNHPLTKKEIKKIEQLGVNVKESFIWPRVPFNITIIIYGLLLVALSFYLLLQDNKRLKVYTPLIISVFSMLYCGLAIQITAEYTGIIYVLMLYLFIGLGLISLLVTLIWEWQNKKA